MPCFLPLWDACALGKDLLVLDSVTAEVNGGRIQGLVAAKENGRVTDLSVDLSISELPLEPVLSILNETESESMSGVLNAQVLLDGHIGNGDGDSTALSGQFEGVISNPVFPLSDSEQSPWLTPVLSALRLPSIELVDIDRIYASVQLDGGVAEVEELSLDANLLKLRSSGNVSVSNSVGETKLELPVDVSIEEGVGRESGLPMKLNKSNSGFGLLPSFLSIRGGLAKPRFEVDRLALARILIESVASGLPVAPTGAPSEPN